MTKPRDCTCDYPTPYNGRVQHHPHCAVTIRQYAEFWGKWVVIRPPDLFAATVGDKAERYK